MIKTKNIDLEVMKSVLELHLKEMIAYNRCTELAFDYATKLDEETDVKGISFEEKIPNTSIKMTPYQNELAVLQYTYEKEGDNHKSRIKNIRETYSFDERFKSLNEFEQTMIYETYFLGKSQKKIAQETNKSQQYIGTILRNVIKKMSEVEL